MNATDYSHWLIRAFCCCEAALAEEIATPSQLCITEELVRSVLVRGLGHTRPGDDVARAYLEAGARGVLAFEVTLGVLFDVRGPPP